MTGPRSFLAPSLRRRPRRSRLELRDVAQAAPDIFAMASLIFLGFVIALVILFAPFLLFL